jgi:hypothetical protein
MATLLRARLSAAVVVVTLCCFALLYAPRLCSQATIVQNRSEHKPPLWSDCQQSLQDSYGFFCDATDTWVTRKAAVLDQAKMAVLTSAASQSCAAYFQTNFEPSLSCTLERRLGSCLSMVLSRVFPDLLGMQGELAMVANGYVTLIGSNSCIPIAQSPVSL